MVNKQKFLSWIKDPNAISAKDLEDLNEITSTFPFCNIAHALTAKGYHNLNSDKFTEKLHKAAIYSVNRKVLKQMIEDTGKSPAGQTDTEKPLEIKKPDPARPRITSPEVSDTEKLHQELQENLQQLHQHKNAQSERVKKQSELIDEFIEKDPKIPQPDLNQPHPKKQEDLSLQSSKIKDDIASENLALIMARQGKTGKAINIYQKLILKFPEKKTYFASRIEELRRNK